MTRVPDFFFGLLIAAFASQTAAETLVASHTVRSKTLLSESDLAVVPGTTPGALEEAEAAIGMEARVVLYAGRPIRPEDIGPPALIERNQTVILVYNDAGLTISTEGRSLARAAAGETVKAMNLASRNTVTGRVDPSGRILVQTTSYQH